ncbi:hypothetical protein ACLOJK_012089 [Asimina triloba]
MRNEELRIRETNLQRKGVLALSMISVVVADVPAMFVFGDSLVDAENNNNLITLLKANYYPNGIDFPVGATGRFCNGATVTDHLAIDALSQEAEGNIFRETSIKRGRRMRERSTGGTRSML